MPSRKINPIIQWWLTPKLPYEHCNVYWKDENTSISHKINIYLKHYLYHPVKRRIAKYYLVLLRNIFGLNVVGITGSAGKTTTKDMLYSILKKHGPTVASYKNIDPVYNIPSTILRCRPDTKYLVLEMGVEYRGEMDFYLWFARPDVGVITNVSTTHTQYFGDTGGVFKEKSKLVKSLPKSATAVLNNRDKFLKKLGNILECRVLYFGTGTQVMSSNEEIYTDGMSFSLIFDKSVSKKLNITIPILGKQFIENALAASACAKVLGIDLKIIKKGLESFPPSPHRMRVIRLKKGATVIDDTYNNNPEAARRSIDLLYDYPGRFKNKVLIFGDMLELGNLEKKSHEDIGKYLGERRYPFRVICIGDVSKHTCRIASKYIGKSRVVYFSSWQDALEEVRELSKKKVIMLVKGSRSMQLDKLVNSL